MANELKHGSVGTELTQAEWEAIGAHVVANQAVGDLIYADTTSQLLRLGVGSTNEVLRVASGKPDWQATTFITGLGTITTGVWQGTDVGVAYGGTGVSTLTANGVLVGNGSSAIGSIDMSTKGHVLIGDGSGNPQMLGVGTNTHVLTADSGETTGIKWAAPAAAAAGSLTGSTLASGVTASSLTSVGTIATGVWQGTDVGVAYGGTGVSTLASNSVLTGNGASAITAEANLTFSGSTLTIVGDVNVGEDDTGHDVKFFGATASAYMLWDQSDDALKFAGAATLEDVGASGNNWTANAIDLPGSGNNHRALTITSTGAYNAGIGLFLEASGTAQANIQFKQGDGGGSANNMRYIMGMDGGGGDFSGFFLKSLDTDGSATASDVYRVYDGNGDMRAHDDWVDDYFDFVCAGCHKHSQESFDCCGPVEWHDDVLALRQMGDDPSVMQRMVDLGVMVQDDGWTGISLQGAHHFSWSAIFQNRQRMDAQYDAVDERLRRIEQAIGV